MQINESDRDGWSRAIMFGLAAVFVLSFGSCTACLIWAAASPQGGVLTANQLEPYARELIDEHDLLRDEERLLVFYDATVSLDGSEVAVISNLAVSYLRDGRVTRYEFQEVEDIQVEEGSLGTNFTVIHESGERLVFDVSAYNSEHLFAETLMDAWAKAYDR